MGVTGEKVRQIESKALKTKSTYKNKITYTKYKRIP